MAAVLSPYHDRPMDWIRDNQSKIARLLELHGDTTVLAALEACLDAGKLDWFFQDFGRYKPEIRETEHGETPRCPGCGTRLYRSEGSFQCAACRRLFDAALSEIRIEPVDTGALVLPWRRA